MNAHTKRIITSIIAMILVLGLLFSLCASVLSTLATSELEKSLTQDLAALKQELSALQEQKNTLNAEQKQIEANRTEVVSEISDINEQLTELSERHAGVMDEKENVDIQMNVTLEQIATSETYIEQLSVQISNQETALADAKEQEAEEYALFKTRIRAMSEYRSVSSLQMILTASSITDIFVRIKELSDIADYDRQVMDTLAQTREKIIAIKTELETSRTEAIVAQEELEAYEADLEAESDQLQALLVRLDEQTAEGNQALAEAEEEEELYELELQAALAELEEQEAAIAAKQVKIQETEEAIVAEQKAEAARIAAEKARKAAEEAALKAKEEEAARIAAEAKKAAEAAAKAKAKEKTSSSDSSQNGNSVSSYSSGTLTWPCPSSYTISSSYGMRTHPITGVYKLHNGIDISASKGVAVVAAASGTVTTVSYTTAWGNYVKITHDNGLQTLYAHLTKATCSVGDTVSAGTKIGTVGSTGYSTGYHLHFTVYLNGSSVNPLNYLG